MAKKLINNTQELINRAQEFRIETEGKSIQDVAQELIDRLMQGYDEYYMYIDNYKQLKQAEQRNNEIDDEVVSIKKVINTLPVQEETIMKTMTKQDLINKAQHYGIKTENVSIEDIAEAVITHLMFCSQLSLPHCKSRKDDIMEEIQSVKAFLLLKKETIVDNNTTNKEEIIMTKQERIQDVARRIEQFTKTSDDGYVTKEEMAELIFDCMGGAKPSTKKHKREQLIETIMIMAGQHKEENSVPVGDLEITKDNAPQENLTVQPATRKTADVLTDVLSNCIYFQYASTRQVAKNYISDYMLISYINYVLHGMYTKDPNTGKDNIFTDEQKTQTQYVKDAFIKTDCVMPHKSKGYIIRAKFMAWYYENALNKHLVYRFNYTDKSKGYVDYKLDYKKGELVNLRDKKTTKLDAAGWTKIDATLNFNRVVQ